MKNIILSIIFFAVTVVSFGQQIEPGPPLTREEYLRKSSKQNIAGWVLTGLGTVIFVSALSYDMGNLFNNNAANTTVYYIASLASIAGGVTLIVAASKNRRRARNSVVYLNIDETLLLQSNGFTSHKYLSAGIRVTIH
jgi:hypothetical protein